MTLRELLALPDLDPLLVERQRAGHDEEIGRFVDRARSVHDALQAPALDDFGALSPLTEIDVRRTLGLR